MRLPAGAEWIIILVIVLLLFGASRLPGLAQSVGKSMRIFRSEVKDPAKDTTTATPGVEPTTGAPTSSATPATGPVTGTHPGTTPGPTTSDDDGGRTHP